MRYLPVLLPVVACSLLSACGSVDSSVGGFRDTGLPDRCEKVLNSAFPGADIEVTDRHVSVAMADAKVQLTGVRDDVKPGSTSRRDVGVECQFDHDVLTNFRWITGPL